MSLSRRNPKRDTSEKAIVSALRRCGWRVDYLSAKDLPDLLLTRSGMTVLAEVKTGKAKLRPGQKALAETWTGGPLVVLRDIEDVLALNRIGRLY